MWSLVLVDRRGTEAMLSKPASSVAAPSAVWTETTTILSLKPLGLLVLQSTSELTMAFGREVVIVGHLGLGTAGL